MASRSRLLVAMLAAIASLGAAGCSAEGDGFAEEDDDEGELRRQTFASSGPGEVEGSIFVAPSPTAFQRGRPGLVRYVVIHDIEGPASAAVNTFIRPGNESSSHYVVDKTGAIIQMVRERDIANHAHHSVLNAYAIGIEHEGFHNRPYPRALYQGSAKAVAQIAKRYRIPLDRAHIVGHHQVPKTDEQTIPCAQDARDCGGKNGHIDPGPAWDWPLYMRLVTEAARAIGYDTSQAIADADYPLEPIAPMETLGLATAEGARPSLIGGFWATQCLASDRNKQAAFRTIFNRGEPARAESRYVQRRTGECGVLQNGVFPLILHGYEPEKVAGLCIERGGTKLKVHGALGACNSAQPACLTGPCPDTRGDCATTVAYPARAGECR